MLRTETGRRRQNHDVHTAVDHFLIRIEPDEAVVGIDFNSVLHFTLECPQAAFQLVVKHVGHRRQDDVFVRVKRLIRSASAASATTNETDAQGLAGRCKRFLGKIQVRGKHRSERGRG